MIKEINDYSYGVVVIERSLLPDRHYLILQATTGTEPSRKITLTMVRASWN